MRFGDDAVVQFCDQREVGRTAIGGKTQGDPPARGGIMILQFEARSRDQ